MRLTAILMVSNRIMMTRKIQYDVGISDNVANNEGYSDGGVGDGHNVDEDDNVLMIVLIREAR